MTELVLFGTGGAAQTVAFHLAAQPGIRIVGYTVDAAWRTAEHHDGRPLVAWEDLEDHFPPDRVTLFGPFSFARMNTLRRDRYLEGKARGYRFARFVHPASTVYAQRIGENCLILDACAVQPFSIIGDNVVVWSMTVVGHHARIGDHCFLSSQVMVAGHADIGPECYLSGQTGIAERRRIGHGSAVLNGAFVTRDLPDGSVVSGPRARLRRYPSSRLHGLI
ncbi:acetyltransferase [Rhodobaculum claviforme]|uniref:Acetyltransferase n=1 Tax=Rhodobaculum claviforme TaxID=1549854 RepID=A0A934WJY8_9RHOB|nr:acetyltransferase [Rhodobaculum claviforme]MBK5928003.1 hypothetical protein [Rhodobaculum claviforme]